MLPLPLAVAAPVDHGNLTLPFVGIVRALPYWASADPLNQLFTAATVAALAVATASIRAHPLLFWSILPWLFLGMVATELVWGLGNNSIRVLAPLWSLGLLGLATRFRDETVRIHPLKEIWVR